MAIRRIAIASQEKRWQADLPLLLFQIVYNHILNELFPFLRLFLHSYC